MDFAVTAPSETLFPSVRDYPLCRLGTYRELMNDRSGFQRAFCELVLAEAGLRGRVLDIGCGGRFPQALLPLLSEIMWLDGVDPSEAIRKHPGLRKRWESRLEDSNVPAGTYDLALAYNVVEHVEDPMPFLAKVCSVLKPGGVFWFLTPHSRHPFCTLVRLAQFAGHRGRLREACEDREGQAIVNEYPAFYRMNCRRDVLRYIRRQGFSAVQFHWMPCMQWDRYFTGSLRWVPHLYDRLLGVRFRSRALLFVAGIRKS